jgi:peptidoglycan/xylan/chitin deacetylase (PgdA/CDA1 family)
VALPILKELGIPATVFVATGFLNGGRMFNDTVIEAVRNLPTGFLELDRLGVEGVQGQYEIAGDADRASLIARLLPHFKYAEPGRREEMLAHFLELAQADLPDDLMMTDEQVCDLRDGGMEIGAHTVTHPILANLAEDRAADELRESKNRLETITGDKITLFAYPNGRLGEDYTERDVRLVRDVGFRAAVSTQPGVAGPTSDPYQLPRFTPWDKTTFRFLARMGMNVVGLIK